MIAHDLTHILSCQCWMNFAQSEEEHILSCFQSPILLQVFANRPEQLTDTRHHQDDSELGHLTQTNQVAGPSQEKVNEPTAQPALAPCSLDQFSKHAFGLLRSSLELHIGSQIGVFQLQVVGKCAEDVSRVF